MTPTTRASRYLPDPIDLVFALALTFGIVALALGSHEYARAASGLLAGLPLAYRRRWPLPVFGLVVVGLVGAARIETFWPAIFAVMAATYSVGVYSRQHLLSAAILLATGTAILLTFGGDVPPPPEFSTPFLILLVPWMVGMMIRDRQLQANAFRDKADRLEQEQERASEIARAEERERIARELHDVIAHSVSVMVVQAGAARQVMYSSPEQATDALLSVESTGREAMTELRNMLGALHSLDEWAVGGNRDEGRKTKDEGRWTEPSGPSSFVFRPSSGTVDLAPQPGIEQLEALVHRVKEAGLPVELHITGKPRPLPQGVSLTAYRIVQEALTNALKYAGRACTQVVLEYRARELKIEVLDEGMSSPAHTRELSGRGLVGMRERVTLYGGVLEAGPRLERGYAVRAWLPLGPGENETA